jgi:hypothetical protein
MVLDALAEELGKNYGTCDRRELLGDQVYIVQDPEPRSDVPLFDLDLLTRRVKEVFEQRGFIVGRDKYLFFAEANGEKYQIRLGAPNVSPISSTGIVVIVKWDDNKPRFY